MRNLPFNLDDRRVVVSVLVLALAVMTLNWRVFQPLRSDGPNRAVSNEESVYVPGDLAGMRDAASRRLATAGSAGGTGLQGLDAAGRTERDPFRKPSDPAPKPIRRATRTGSRVAPAKLACSAVMLGGDHPIALINDRPYGPGETVAGYRVVRVDDTGVQLLGAGGRLFLPVGGTAKATVHYPPVRTDSRPTSNRKEPASTGRTKS